MLLSKSVRCSRSRKEIRFLSDPLLSAAGWAALRLALRAVSSTEQVRNQSRTSLPPANNTTPAVSATVCDWRTVHSMDRGRTPDRDMTSPSKTTTLMARLTAHAPVLVLVGLASLLVASSSLPECRPQTGPPPQGRDGRRILVNNIRSRGPTCSTFLSP